jgi:outer membrane protein assembly factor BamB
MLTRGGALHLGSFRFVDLRTGALLGSPESPWPSSLGRRAFVFEDGIVFAHPGGELSLADASTRAERWRIQLAPGEGVPVGTYDVWVYPWQWAHVGPTLVAIDHPRGERREAAGPLRARGFRLATGARTWDAVVASTGHDALLAGNCEGTFLVDVTAGLGHPGTLVAFDAATGIERWRRDGVIDVRPGEIQAGCSDGRVMATVGHDVRLLDLHTGRDLWSHSLGAAYVLGATLADDAVFVLTGNKGELVALAASDGHELWRTRSIGPRYNIEVLAASRQRVFWPDRQTLRVFDRATGAPLWTFTLLYGPGEVRLLRDRGMLLLFGGFGFDPDRDLPPRTVTLSGRVTIAPEISAEISPAGIEIVVGDARTVTDAQGRFTLAARGRGSMKLNAVLTYRSPSRATGPPIPVPPTAVTDCIAWEHDHPEVDFERDPPALAVTSVLTRQPCPRTWTE